MIPRTAKRTFAMLLLAMLALAPLGMAQSLAALLPSETMLALGTTGLNDHTDLFEDFLQEFEERGVGDALLTLYGGVEDEMGGMDDMEPEIPEALSELGPLDLIGREAWIAVSASQFNPIPAVTLVARMSDTATAAFGTLIDDAAARDTVQELTEGTVTFWLMAIEDPESPAQALAYTQVDGVTMLSSNPDVLRGALRRMAGSGEPGFTTSPAHDATLGQLGDGQFFGFLDLGSIATAAAPFARSMGFAPLVERLEQALTTAGSNAGVVRLVAGGIETEGVTAPNPAGGDVGLYNLLTTTGSYDPATLDWAPSTTLSVNTGYVDLTGWWNWLNDLIGSVPELGIQSLDQALLDFLGIDLRATFFDWTGTQVATVTTGIADANEPGMTASNLLGEQVYLIETTAEAEARAGLSALLNNIAASVAAFADPTGGPGGLDIAQVTIEGVTVDMYQITAGVQLATAVTNGYAFIATSQEAMELVLTAGTANAGLSPVFDRLLDDVPSGVKSLTLSDSRAVAEASGLQFASLIQLGSGFAGASNLDFEAVTQASETLEGYVLFIASRLGGTVSHLQVENNRIHTQGRTEISW